MKLYHFHMAHDETSQLPPIVTGVFIMIEKHFLLSYMYSQDCFFYFLQKEGRA